MTRYARILLLFAVTAAPAFGATRPYHLRLEAYPAAPFPYFSKFGTVTIDVYSGGVHADSFWLSGFSRTGSSTITVQNPVLRMYTDVPIRDIAPIVSKLSGGDPNSLPPPVLAPVTGKVSGLTAQRYRIVYGPTAWIDMWTTPAIAPNPQFLAVIRGLLEGISPSTARAARTIPGTPLYVELNFRRFKKVPLVRLKKLAFDNAGETDALKTGSFYFKAPLLDAIWR